MWLFVLTGRRVLRALCRGKSGCETEVSFLAGVVMLLLSAEPVDGPSAAVPTAVADGGIGGAGGSPAELSSC